MLMGLRMTQSDYIHRQITEPGHADAALSRRFQVAHRLRSIKRGETHA